MTSHEAFLLFFDLALILVVARVFGAAARRLRQPAVIGEILAGILLGPTLLHGGLTSALFPTDIRPPLTALADIGIALFMFTVGLEFDPGLLRGLRVTAGAVAAGAMLVPFALALPLALRLSHGQAHGSRAAFVLFLATAMSITAFPVLARILDDRGMVRTTLGGIALASAAICDVLAWTLLAISTWIAAPHGTAPWETALVLPAVATLFLVGRPLLRAVLKTEKAEGRGEEAAAGTAPGLVVVLAVLLGMSAFLQWIGLNFIFGGFLVGVIVPQGGADRLHRAVEQVSVTLLMPAFFVIAGLAVDLTKLGVSGIGTLLLILATAIGGKFIGTLGAARVFGVGARQSAALGALMNARGLTELVVLAVGVQLGILDHRTYSMMVLMALVTTAMAGPLLDRLHPCEALPAGVRAEAVASETVS